MIVINGCGDAQQLYHRAAIQLLNHAAAFRFTEVHAAVGDLPHCTGRGGCIARCRAAACRRRGCCACACLARLHRVFLPRGSLFIRQGGKKVPMDVAHVGAGIAVVRMFHIHLIPRDAAGSCGFQQLANIAHVNAKPVVRIRAGLLAHAHTVGGGFAVSARRPGSDPLRRQGQQGQHHSQRKRKRCKAYPGIDLLHGLTSVSPHASP